MRLFSTFLIALAALAAGCEDSTGFRIDPLLSTDTVELAVPGAALELPTALDIAASGGAIGGGRFPERQQDAGAFDFVLRRRDGGLALVPAGAIGLETRSGITRALPGETFESLVEAPGRGAFLTDTAVVLQQGAVYAARSRLVPCGFGQGQQFAKLQPLVVEEAAGRVVLQITTNARCEDPRLVLED